MQKRKKSGGIFFVCLFSVPRILPHYVQFLYLENKNFLFTVMLDFGIVTV